MTNDLDLHVALDMSCMCLCVACGGVCMHDPVCSFSCLASQMVCCWFKQRTTERPTDQGSQQGDDVMAIVCVSWYVVCRVGIG